MLAVAPEQGHPEYSIAHTICLAILAPLSMIKFKKLSHKCVSRSKGLETALEEKRLYLPVGGNNCKQQTGQHHQGNVPQSDDPMGASKS